MHLTKFKKLITTTLLAAMACFCLTAVTNIIDTAEEKNNYSIMPLEDRPLHINPTQNGHFD